MDSSVKLGEDVKIGAYSVVEPDVTIGDGTIIGNHVTISSNTKIGSECQIFHSASIGAVPQDLKYDDEKTLAQIGDRTIIREFVTINKGTSASGKTIVGSDCLLMACVHIAHDCIIRDHVIMSNLTTLGGHVTIDAWAILSGGVLVHQFCKIGAHSFVGAGGFISQDVPPFILAAGSPLEYSGINSVGLKRRGFSNQERQEIKNIYKIFFLSKNNRKKNLEKIKKEFSSSENTKIISDFINNSERGII